MIAQELSEDRRVSSVRFTGKITPQEFAEYQQSVYARNNSDQWASFIDFSALISLELDFDRVRAHANSINSINSTRRPGFTEIIFAPTDLGFGMARMYQTLAEGQFEVVVCREKETAQEALDAVLNDSQAVG